MIPAQHLKNFIPQGDTGKWGLNHASCKSFFQVVIHEGSGKGCRPKAMRKWSMASLTTSCMSKLCIYTSNDITMLCLSNILKYCQEWVTEPITRREQAPPRRKNRYFKRVVRQHGLLTRPKRSSRIEPHRAASDVPSRATNPSPCHGSRWSLME